MKFTLAMKHNGLLRKTPNTSFFEVRESFIWYLDYSTKKEKIVVPKGFITNFGSIPRLLRFIFDPTRYISYILHDYLYSKNCVIVLEDGTTRKPTRNESDLILLEGLNLEGAGKIEKTLIYSGVRIGGSPHFDKN